jgi:hypothetical protein
MYFTIYTCSSIHSYQCMRIKWGIQYANPYCKNAQEHTLLYCYTQLTQESTIHAQEIAIIS